MSEIEKLIEELKKLSPKTPQSVENKSINCTTKAYNNSGSLGVTIPKSCAKYLGITPGTMVNLTISVLPFNSR